MALGRLEGCLSLLRSLSRRTRLRRQRSLRCPQKTRSDPAAEEEAAYLQGLLDLANLLARGGAIADLATLSAEGMAYGEPLTASRRWRFM